MKIGILGGTFNPPHKGHVKLGLDFANELSLDRVLVIPAKVPTHKTAPDLLSGKERLKLCSLAFDNDIFEVSDIEIKSEKDSYTVFTLEALEKLYPDDEFYLIIGSDMFLIFDRWYRFEDILKKCTVCVEARQDSDSIIELKNFAKTRLGIDIKGENGERIIISQIKPFPVSSTEIRQRIKDGRGVKRLIPEKELEYIISRRLYLD